MLLSDDIITLRAPEPSDTDRLYIWENDPELWPFGSATAPMSRQMLASYIGNYDADIFASRQLRFMIVVNATGETAGTLDVTDFDPRHLHACTGIFIEPAHRGRGVARRALTLAGHFLAEAVSMHTLMATVAVDNMPSRRLYEACGYSTAGRLRSYIRRGHSYQDALIYQIILK
ncbi:MAG: GNAT family N-acetyltransferase [Muribaculaceae bacterium]|nr:GNAT family N-acetyltransferase [Muribaculaceae bacterium]